MTYIFKIVFHGSESDQFLVQLINSRVKFPENEISNFQKSEMETPGVISDVPFLVL